MVDWKKLKAKLKCCACEGTLKDSELINMIGLMKVAKWKMPHWGNATLRVWRLAMAVVCDRCVKEKKQPKFAVEWDNIGVDIKYHPVDELNDVPKEIFKPLGMLEPGRQRVAG